MSGGRTESGGRIKWCTVLDAVQTKVRRAVQWGMGSGGWTKNSMMPETPKTLGALASRYRKIVGTELMVKATRMVEKTQNFQ